MATGGAAGEDRGRFAERPSQIPARGWKDVLLRVWREIGADHISLVAAGVAFYGLLAAFPAISALVLIYGLAADPAEVQRQIGMLEGVVPADAYGILAQQTTAVAAEGAGTLSLGLLFSLVLALWSARQGVTALMTALNISYEEEERRGFLQLNITALALTLGGLLFFLVALALIAALPAAIEVFQLTGALGDVTLLWTRWVAIAAMMIGALAVLYRFGPSRSAAKFRWLSWGAAIATALWLAGSLGFSLYVANFANYNETFGSLGAVVVLLMWFYISAYVICAGAEVNAELERQTVRDTTAGPEKPIGRRGAFVADNKPPARAVTSESAAK